MKANFDSKDNRNSRHAEMSTGGFEAMIKAREEKLPRMQEVIQDILDDWTGTAIAIVMVNEDENGKPESHSTIMTGVGNPKSQLKLAKALNQASESAMDALLEAAKGDTASLVKTAMDMMEEITNDIKGDK